MEAEPLTLEELSQIPTILRYMLSLHIAQSEASAFINSLKRKRDPAEMKSLQAKGAGAWLEAVPVWDI